jgi:SAM-dependent methyltransferase
MVSQPLLDSTKTQAFADKVISDLVTTLVIAMCNLGDRLGLFHNLAQHGPATSGELAVRTSLNERYVREWLSALASADYLHYDPVTKRFSLPPEHIPALADERSADFQGGRFQYLPALFKLQDSVAEAFREGGGVPSDAYPQEFWDGIERTVPAWAEHKLVQHWIAIMPDVQAKLVQGALVADVGCGQGGALVKLAQVFPRSHFVGYDIFEPSVSKAIAAAQAAGVSDRLRFEALDVTQGLPESFDFIMTHEVIHDAADPLRMLQAIREGLKPDGTYLMKEYNASDKLEENRGLIGPFMYSISVLFCMTTSLAEGGAGLGTAGLPEPIVRALCTQAGFSQVHRLPIVDAFSAFYAMKR